MRQVKQSDKVLDETPTKKQKLKNLHKMLDKQIQTKDNGFQEIQLKLKQLEVKLNSIKQDNHIPSLHQKSLHRNHNSEQKLNQDYHDHNFAYKQKQHQSLNNNHFPSQQFLHPPFQSLSKYKKSKNQKNTNGEQYKKSEIQVQKNKSSENIKKGKKLNFDEPDQNLSTSCQKKRKLLNFASDDKKKLSKIKSQNNLYKRDKRKRNVSHNSRTNSIQKSEVNKMTANSTKEIRFSSCKRKNNDQSWKSQKKNNKKKQRVHNQNQISWKLLKNEYDWKSSKANTESNKKLKDNLRQMKLEANQRQQGRKQRIKQIISNTEKKKLERELQAFKMQNQDLQKQINQLKGYKHQYQKLRVIFVKQQKLRNHMRKS